MLLGQAGSTLGAQQLKCSHNACACVGSVAGHIGSAAGHSVGGTAHLGGVGSSLGVGRSDDVVGSVDLALVQNRDGSVGLQSADHAAVDGDLQVGIGQSGVDRAHSLASQQSDLRGGGVCIGGSQTSSLTDAAGDVIGRAGNEALGVHDGQHGDVEGVAQADEAGSLGHTVVAQLLTGRHHADRVAADGSKCGVDALAEACKQLHGAVLINEGSRSLLRSSTSGQDRGGLLELEDGGAGQVVGGQQTHDVGSLLRSLGSALGHDGSNTSLGSSLSRACICDLVALGGRGEGSGEEQLGVLCHDADICAGSVQGAGTAAHAGDDCHLGHDAGHLGDGSVQLSGRGQNVQTLCQLCADRVVERDHGAARLSSHFEDLDVLLNVLHGDCLAVLVDGVGLLASRIAAGSAHRAVRKQCGIFPVIEKLGEDFSFVDL